MVPTPMKPIRIIADLLWRWLAVLDRPWRHRVSRGWRGPPEGPPGTRAGGLRPVYYRPVTLGLVLIGVAAISWGTTGATMALVAAQTDLSPLVVGWARLAIAAPCLIAAAAASRLAGGSRPAGRRARVGGAPGRRWRAAAAYAALGLAMAAYQACYFRAVTLAGVSVTALLAICSAPVIMAVLGSAWLGEPVGRRVAGVLLLAVIGTALLFVGPRGLGHISGRFAGGALLALGAGVSYAVYAVVAKQVLSRAAPLPVAAITFSLGAVFLAPALLGQSARGGDLARAAPLLLYLGLVPTAVAYGLFTAGLDRVPTARAGIATLLEPLTAAVLGVALFGESLGAMGWAGAALLLAALTLLLTTRH
jgi:DME family drug/metabolite transporter